MKIVSVVGARPQFIKLAPIHKALAKAGIYHTIAHTGQHYDPMLSDVFFADLDITPPDVRLGVGSGSHGVQTGAMLAAMDTVLEEHRPDWVLVYGDTNSTLAGALSAAKMHIPVAHLEAGLRSFNRRMPEEHNRIVTDHVSDLLLAPTEKAVEHLAREGLAERAVLVGDVMTDVLFQVRDQVLGELPEVSESAGLNWSGYYVATIHRAENTDDMAHLEEVVKALSVLEKPVILLTHPRLATRAKSFGIDLNRGALISHPAVAYPELIRLLLASAGVVTDSGGLQKESFLLGIPCTTVRNETEWRETLQNQWNVLASSAQEIAVAASRPWPEATLDTPYGKGDAAARVVDALQDSQALNSCRV